MTQHNDNCIRAMAEGAPCTCAVVKEYDEHCKLLSDIERARQELDAKTTSVQHAVAKLSRAMHLVLDTVERHEILLRRLTEE